MNIWSPDCGPIGTAVVIVIIVTTLVMTSPLGRLGKLGLGVIMFVWSITLENCIAGERPIGTALQKIWLATPA